MRGNEKSCVNWSDYGARYYDAQLGRFHTIDRFAEKYNFLSPYNYVANNPINSIDINGDSIYVMLDPSGANGAGHIGMLIQNKKGKWALWSKNGAEEIGAASGKTPTDKDHKNAPDLGTKTFDSPEAFLNSDANIKDKESGEKTYTKGTLIATSYDQDRDAEAGAKKELYNKDGSLKDYDLLSSSCGTMVRSALKSAGLKDGGESKLLHAISPPLGQLAKEAVKAPNILFYRIAGQNINSKPVRKINTNGARTFSKGLKQMGNPANHNRYGVNGF